MDDELACFLSASGWFAGRGRHSACRGTRAQSRTHCSPRKRQLASRGSKSIRRHQPSRAFETHVTDMLRRPISGLRDPAALLASSGTRQEDHAAGERWVGTVYSGVGDINPILTGRTAAAERGGLAICTSVPSTLPQAAFRALPFESNPTPVRKAILMEAPRQTKPMFPQSMAFHSDTLQ